jgi:hypothetical protein
MIFSVFSVLFEGLKQVFDVIFMISADYATYEKYVETCLHVKEDFRKEKTVSA